MLAITPKLGVNAYNNIQKTPDVETPRVTKHHMKYHLHLLILPMRNPLK